MPKGGDLRIEVSTTEAEGKEMVALSIRDTGIGMGAQVKSHLFEPFYTTKDRGKGTGLGLSIVYGIVNQSSGTIRVDSQIGRGTSVEILLPRVFVNEPPVAACPKTEAAAPICETILLVEDEDALRGLAREVLRASGYTVLEAPSGEDAVVALGNFPGTIALLVTDMIMPGMSGSVLAAQLRDSLPDLKVLYISGYTEDLLDGHGELSDATAFLQKPFTPAVLTRTVRELLDGRS
jgi:CheY-like chemotaxis protein